MQDDNKASTNTQDTTVPQEPVVADPDVQQPEEVKVASDETNKSNKTDAKAETATLSPAATPEEPAAEEVIPAEEESTQVVEAPTQKTEKNPEIAETVSVESAEGKPQEDDQVSQDITTDIPTRPSDIQTVTGGVKPHWYVVHTYSGHETKVAATLKQRVESQKLQDKILDILVPTQEKIEIKEGKKTNIKEKIFPGYLLIRMALDDNTWLAVRTTPGITSFVGNANKPTPLPEAEVESIKKFMSMEAPKFKATFSVGEAVRITDGPFSEFLGSINEIDEERGKLKVMVSIFGRETPVELDFLQVAKL
ncbi:MAG TPA: transcription termination/antitermination protein NusG [Candidatus Saccharimonadales bacterium]|nr:transcription termination/antitermination protein NusG [Candidatus Saccharimonadales bacterium]